MKLAFSKMHGLGNDFIVIDGINQAVQLNTNQLQVWADRHTGIGFDQVLLLEPATLPEYDFLYRVFNADGSEVAQCGNGARCVARFIQLKQLSNKTSLNLQTQNGSITTHLLANDLVNVNMGAPRFAPIKNYTVNFSEQTLTINKVSMGNPHAVIVVDSIATAPVAELGALLQTDPHFPERVNVGFMQIINRDTIALRVYERGVGETLACGSGACAAVVIGNLLGLLNAKVTVNLPSGQLVISWQGGDNAVFLAGPASFVFDGVIES